MRRVKLGLIGAGLIMNNAHAPALEALRDRFEIAAICSRTEKSARALAERFGRPPIYTDYRRLLEQPDVEAVDVAVPIALNYEICKAAAQAGKHIICEKPPAANLADAAAAARLPAEYGIVFLVAEQFRYLADMRKARHWVAAGAIGKPILARWTIVQTYDPANPYAQTAWRQQPAHIGGILSDAGVHYMDALRSIVGEVESVQAFVAGHGLLWGPHDTAVINLRLAGDVLANMSMTWSAADRVNMLEIFGAAGTVRVAGGEATLLRPDRAPEKFKAVDSQGFREEFEDFYAAIVRGKALDMTPREAYLDFAVFVAAIHSAETGQVIEMQRYLQGAGL